MASNVLFQRGDGDEDGDSDAWDDTALIKAYDKAVSAMKAKVVEQHPEFSIPNGGTASKKKKKSKPKAKKKRSSLKQSHGWKVGDPCQAMFTEDGEIYSAEILSINDDDTCIVKYVDYGNEEEQMLDSLLPALSEISSQDNKSETVSEVESVKDNLQGSKYSNRHRSHNGTYVGGKSSRSCPPPWNWNNFTVPPPPNPSAAHHFPAFHPQPNFGPSTHIPPLFPGIPPPPPVFNNPGTESENEALYSMLISWYMSGYHTGYYQGIKNVKSSPFMGGHHR